MLSPNSNVAHITYSNKTAGQNLYEPTDNSCHPQSSMSHWLFDPKLLPGIYHQIIGAVTSSFGLDSSLIYEVFLTSGLNQPILQHIWSKTSQSHPGWFTPAELVSALALIGLAQAEQANHSNTSLETLLHALSLERLHTLLYPPIPHVQLPAGRPMVELRTTNQTNVGSISRISPNHPAVTSNAFKKQSQATWKLDALPDHKNNSFSIEAKPAIILCDPGEDDWADFTSCKPPVDEGICRPVDPLNTIKCDFEWPVREHTKPTKLPDNRDDDFGEFQTSNQVESDQNSTKAAEVSDQTKANPPFPLRPNYNVSVDPSSEMTPLEFVQHEWLRCVVQCTELMRDSLDALELINTDAEKAEFNETEEGVEFFSDILEVYRVANRIKGSAERLALLHAPLQIRFAEIKNAMSKLFHYIVKDDIKAIWTSVLLRSVQDTDSSLDALAGFINPNSTEPLCGVCLSPFSSDAQLPQSGTIDSSLTVGSVALAGRIYHTPCANLWINRVQLSLPALVPP